MFRCKTCDYKSMKWIGKCPDCGEWNTFEETNEGKSKDPKKKSVGNKKETLKIIKSKEAIEMVKLKSNELNCVLGGGITEGSLSLLSGEPGIGKSTLSLQLADWYASDKNEALYVSSEENIFQLSGRATRLGIQNQNIHILNASILEDIIETIETSPVSLVIIDSISVICSQDIAGASGSINQIRYMAERFMEIAKRTKKSIILIGHVTKDGSISGPKVLEHLVDTVLYLEGSKYESYRIIRSLKNRFGPTDEVGLFLMTDKGLKDLENPGLEFINKDDQALSGSALAMTIEGNRPMLIEIEALTTYTKFGYPKRSARGISGGKLDLIIAVITKFTETKLESYDVYLNIARGLTIQEPGIDLASIAAIISSKKGKSLGKTVFIGEVSLTGVIKNVFELNKRVDECIKLGFEKIVVPAGVYSGKNKTKIIEIKNIKELEKVI